MDSLKTEKIRISKQGDVFITKTATKTLTNTQLVEKVIGFHFKDLIKALSTYSSIEISGFGKFEISNNKLKRKLKELRLIHGHMVKQLETGTYTRPTEQMHIRIAGLEKDIAYLSARTTDEDETKFQRYCRRMEEHLLPTSSDKGTDTGNK